MTKKELLTRVMAIPGVKDEATAERAVTAVFTTLRDRLTPEEADDVWAQLPTSWKEMWESGSWWERITAGVRKVDKLDRDEFVNKVQQELKDEVPAQDAVCVIFHALKEQISKGEAEDVSSQLPGDLREMWKAA